MAFVNKTKTMILSNTVFFKYKFIMQPILTPEVAITKALGDLWQAITQACNIKGECSFEALKPIDELFTKAQKQDLLVQRKDRKVQFNDEAPRVHMYSKGPRVNERKITGLVFFVRTEKFMNNREEDEFNLETREQTAMCPNVFGIKLELSGMAVEPLLDINHEVGNLEIQKD